MGRRRFTGRFLLRFTRFWYAFWTVSRSLVLRLRTLGLPAYRYVPLKDPSKDIRLVTVLPGGCGDDIIIRIRHVALESRKPSSSPPLTIQEIHNTLQEPWAAYETIEGRCLFMCTGAYGEGDPTWNHPNPNTECSKYERVAEVSRSPADGFTFDALSYVWGTYSWFRQRRALVECSEVSSISPSTSCY
jgi:hypothetical protein